MTLHDILEKALGIICDDDIDLDVVSKKRTRLISCGNMIYAELTEQYIHLKNEENLTATDGRIYYADFSKKVREVLSVKKNGINISFTAFPLYIACEENGEYTVRYVYTSNELLLTDEVILPPKYTTNVLAMGIASEYFYRSGLVDEAVFYKNRYDNALLNLSRKNNNVILKKRSFI